MINNTHIHAPPLTDPFTYNQQDSGFMAPIAAAAGRVRPLEPASEGDQVKD